MTIDRADNDERLRQLVGRLWDEGLASGYADPAETTEDILAKARVRKAKL